MIERIQSIYEFGLFKEFDSSPDLNSFTRYNLIYGWNGSGKSTLSKLLYFISEKKIPKDFENATFQIKTNSGIIDSSSFAAEKDIKVFNEDFIQDNIDWDNIVKSLLYVSKAKVEDKKKLEDSVDNLNLFIKQIKNLENEISTQKAENENFLTDTGKEIKRQFEVLKTEDSTYINYTKRNLRKLIDKYDALRNKKDIIAEKNVEKLKIIARLEFLDKIEIDELTSIDINDYEELQTKINNILKTNIVSESISGLKNNIELNQWVERGLRLHINLKKCKFCDNDISENRRNKLNAHFSENYIKIKDELLKLLERAENSLLREDTLSFDSFTIYPFLKESWNKEIVSYKINIKEINENISLFIQALQKKLSNPFDIGINKVVIRKTAVNNYNKCIENFAKIFKEHNHTTNSFYEKVTNAKESLELFYAQKEIKRFKYFERLTEIDKKEQSLVNLNLKLLPIEKEITRLEASLTDEVLGAEEFNTKLHRFLNHSDINLKFDKKSKGYKIIRKDGNGVSQAKHLSEGEKTAISFVFFLTKLGEIGFHKTLN